MSRLTAHEARELAGPTADEYVDAILVKVKQAAKNGLRQYCCTDSEDSKFWVYDAYGGTKEYERAKKILTDLGFKVTFFYNCGQFVDMYTIISW